MKQELEINYSKFNEQQLCHYNEIIESYKNEKKTQLFFISGSGGTGKSFFYNTILAKIRSENNIALAMASTGIASILLDGDQTAHSTS